MTSSRPRFVLPLAAALCALLALGGCKDQRENATGPSAGGLDGDTLFATANVSTHVYRFHNALVDVVLDILQDPTVQPPVLLIDCLGNSSIQVNPGTTANDVRLTFDNASHCAPPLQLTVNGQMLIDFDSLSGDISYTLTMPWSIGVNGDGDPLLIPEGMVYDLLPDDGGFTLEFTGQIEGVQSGNNVLQTGTVRIEDRSGGITLVEELSLEYAFQPTAQFPRFADWPAGSYEIAAFAGSFFGATATNPSDVQFDGFGGATFQVGNTTCQADLARQQNPCDD